MLLELIDLHVSVATEQGWLPVLRGINLSVGEGETLGLVGESGCGKSMTALAALRLLPLPGTRIDSGDIRFRGQSLRALAADSLHQLRGQQLAMIFQDPMSALNPVHSVGQQLREVYRLHRPGMSERQIREACEQQLARVGIPEPRQRLDEYPHLLSGGMRQRVMIAMALACHPALLVADEPTTALDVTVQAQILGLIRDLQRETGMGVLFISHDLGVVGQMADRIAVMYGGKIVEQGSRPRLLSTPHHPYSQGLLSSSPGLQGSRKTRLAVIPGNVPALAELGSGCPFASRCNRVSPQCAEMPALERVDAQELVACHHWREPQP